MRPQLQKYRHDEGNGQFGDCHRTCIAMILDMDRDDVPHFMDGWPSDRPADHPDSIAAERRERDWIRAHGLTPVNIAYDGSMDLQTLLDQLGVLARETAVILGCTSSNGFNHNVVVYEGRIFNPNDSTIRGPMRDGMWWITTYATLTEPLPQGDIERLAMRDPAVNVVMQEND